MHPILGIDTTGAYAHAAIISEGRILSESSSTGSYYTESLTALIEEVVSAANISMSSLEKVVVAVGPGSFTGIRSGIATSYGLQLGLAIPVVGVSVMRARLEPSINRPGLYVPILTANKKEKFFALFLANSNLSGGWQIEQLSEVLTAPEELLNEAIGAAISDLSKSSIQVAIDYPWQENKPGNPASLAVLAVQGLAEDKPCVFNSIQAETGVLQPLYVKKVQAKTIAERKAFTGVKSAAILSG